MNEKQVTPQTEKPQLPKKDLQTAPAWTDRDWFEIWLRMARRTYPAALR